MFTTAPGRLREPFAGSLRLCDYRAANTSDQISRAVLGCPNFATDGYAIVVHHQSEFKQFAFTSAGTLRLTHRQFLVSVKPKHFAERPTSADAIAESPGSNDRYAPRRC
jgi:hypothetical protein